MNIDEMLTLFNESADNSKLLLQNMLGVVVAGKVPTESDMQKLDKSVANLREKYNAICSIAMSEVSTDEMPEEGASASEYIDAVRNSIAAVYRRKLDEARIVLKQFISVQSLLSACAAALQPFQQEAESLMAVLNEEAQSVEELEEKITGPKLFLESVNCKDFDSDEGMNLLDQVAEYYPNRVQYGLTARKYFIPAGEKGELEDTIEVRDERLEGAAEEATEEVNSDSVVSTRTDGVDKDVTSTQQKLEREENNQIEDVSDKKSEEKEEIRATDKKEEHSTFTQRVLNSGLLIDDASKVGFLSCDISDSENKKLSLSVFQNDIRKGSEKALKLIIREICSQNNMTPDYLTLMTDMSEQLAISSLEYLQKKGYLRKYRLDPWGEFYCASPRLMKSLTYKDVVKMIGIRQSQVEDLKTTIYDKNTSVACRIVYGKLCRASVAALKKVGKPAITEKTNTFTDAFFSRVFSTDEEIGCDINIGVFWDRTDKANKFLEKLKNSLETVSGISRVIFAALSVEKAKILADIILDEVEDVRDKAPIYLYSLSDDCYYTYPTCKVTDSGECYAMETEDVNEDKAEGTEGEEKLDNASVDIESSHQPSDDLESYAATDRIQPAEVSKIEEPKVTPVGVKTASGDREKFIESIISLINEDKFYAATAFAKAVSLQHPEYTMLYNQLSYALNDPMGHCNYSTNNAFNLIEKKGDFEDALVISTAIRTFFSNQVRYDYNIKSYYSGIKEYKLLSDYPTLSKVVYSLMEFKDNHQKGMDAYADYRSRSKSELEQELSNLRRDAQVFYENFIAGRKKEKASQKRFIETKKLIFSASSEFGEYIKAIADGDDDLQPLAFEFLQANFYKEDSTVEEDTIDSDK